MNIDQPSQELYSEKESALQAFIEKNLENITQLGNTKEALRYVIVGEEEGTDDLNQGYYQKMVSLLIDELKLPLVEVKQEEMNNVVAELREGNLEIVFGLPKMEDKITSIPATKNEVLVLVAKRKDITLETVPYYYWGTEEYYQDFLKDSILEERTILFNSKEDLKEAYQLDEIEGMLLKDSTYQNYKNEGEEIYLISEIKIPMQEYILVADRKEDYATFLQVFLPFYEEYCMVDETTAFSTTTKSLPIKEKNKDFFFFGLLLCFGLTILAFILYTMTHFIRIRKQKVLAKKLYQELIRQEKEEKEKKEVLVIDLLRGKAWSNYGFECFLSSERKRKNRKLKELSRFIGFGFAEHYRYITQQFERNYQFEYQLYLEGVCYRILEEGIFEQGVLVLFITRENLENKEAEVKNLVEL